MRRSCRRRPNHPERPNQSQGWIKASDVRIYQHPYRMVVSVGRHLPGPQRQQGCIRVSNAVITSPAKMLAIGVPVRIVR